MTDLSTEPFTIGITCMFPNIFEPRPQIQRVGREHHETYSVRFNADKAEYSRPDEKVNVMHCYSKYLPEITVTANRPPIITAVGGRYEVLRDAVEIGRVRRKYLDGMLKDARAEITVEWFFINTPVIKNKWALSLREIKIDEFDLFNLATE